MWSTELATGITRCTPVNLRIFGLDPAEPPPTPEGWLAIIHPEDRDRLLAEWSAALKGNGEYSIEYRIVRPDGAVRWVNSKAQLQRDADGQPSRFIGVTLDITERKWNEYNAHFLAGIQRTLLSTQGADLITGVLQGLVQHLSVNQALFCDLDVKAERVRVQYEFSDGRPSVIDEYRTQGFMTDEARQALSAGQSLVVTDVAKDPRTREHAENYRPFQIAAFLSVPMLGEQGLVGVIALHSAAPREWRDDEVKLVQTIAARLRLAHERGAAEARVARLADAMPQMVWIAHGNGVLRYCNRQWYAYTGLLQRETQGVSWLEATHPDDRDRALERWMEVRRSEGLYEIDHRVRRHDGIYRWFLTRAVPFDDPAYGPMWIGTSTDVEEQRRDKELLQEADRLKDEFLATLAHELRNPLAPLTTSLQIMKMEAGNADTVGRTCTLMERQVTHMVNLVDDLLDINRLSRGMLRLRKTKVSVASIVRDAVDASRPILQGQRQELTLEMPADPLYIEADPTRITQVLMNLLMNASKFSDAGSAIRLTVARHDTEVAFTVDDFGKGIPKHMLGRVFDMFVQIEAPPGNAGSGLGLGLPIAKKLVELHSGTIEAHSDGVGKGSRFTVRLPAALQPVPSDSPTLAMPERERAVRRIMVADDNVDAAESLAMLLKLQGHDTRVAHDGLEALAVAETFLPDVALLDIGMPELNGYEVCRKLREHPWGKRIVVVALTGWGQAEDKRRAVEAGFDAHFVKPLNTDLLADLLSPQRQAKNVARS
jgi:PAS domain S-box-containing protein